MDWMKRRDLGSSSSIFIGYRFSLLLKKYNRSSGLRRKVSGEEAIQFGYNISSVKGLSSRRLVANTSSFSASDLEAAPTLLVQQQEQLSHSLSSSSYGSDSPLHCCVNLKKARNGNHKIQPSSLML